ncbi:G5 domain-containing protein [Abiotrophia defectiva]|uniref:G5 domain-containing protein n=1 Tax=Abiotrophia defectiva TaxID=46125 RepID=UPI002280AFB4|nr:G5 domain-containing protein [Abiotrophia defectiva]MCY7224486.1 G5 domain-containing protein [Abiotrophia defectiva]
MTQELKKKLLNVVALSGLVAASFPVSEVLQHQATPAVYAQEDQSAPDDEELPDAVDLAAIKAAEQAIKDIKDAYNGAIADGSDEEEAKADALFAKKEAQKKLNPIINKTIKNKKELQRLTELYNKEVAKLLGETPLPEPFPQQGPKVEVREETETMDIDFGYEVVQDANLDKGQKEIVTPGKKGTLTITYTVEYRDGVRQANTRKEKSRQRTVEPVNQVEREGTRDVVTTENAKEVEDIPFEKKTEETDQLDKGKTQLKTPGKKGVLTKTYRYKVINGLRDEATKELVSSEVTVEPVAEVTLVGTRPVVTTQEISEESEIPYGTQTQQNANLAKGVKNTVRPGVKGKKKVTYTITLTDGIQTDKQVKNTEILTPAVDEIIEVGTKEEPVVPERTRHENVRTETVAFDIVNKDSDQLDLGQTQIETEGTPGVRTITEEWYADKDGVEIPGTRKVIGDAVTTQPVARVVLHGVKPVKRTRTETKEVDFKTVRKDDPTLAKGETKTETQGVKGQETITYEYLEGKDGLVAGSEKEVKRETTLQPVDEVILVGTKEEASSESSSESSSSSSESSSQSSSESSSSSSAASSESSSESSSSSSAASSESSSESSSSSSATSSESSSESSSSSSATSSESSSESSSSSSESSSSSSAASSESSSESSSASNAASSTASSSESSSSSSVASNGSSSESSSSSTSNDPGQNGKKPGKKDEGKKLPKTGESQNITFLMGIMMMFASAVVALFRRKQN